MHRAVRNRFLVEPGRCVVNNGANHRAVAHGEDIGLGVPDGKICHGAHNPLGDVLFGLPPWNLGSWWVPKV